MKVLLSNVSRKNGYMIIDVFFSVLSGMNYPVLAHDDTMLKFIDVDAKEELKRALLDYRGSVLLICHEPEFYKDVVNEVWDMSKWTTKIL